MIAVLVAAAGVLVGLVVATRTRDVRVAIRCALEMWTAAGALHLAATSSWAAIGSAASIIAVRKLAAAGLRKRPYLASR